MLNLDSPIITILISSFALVLGLPSAIAIIAYEDTWVPSIILASKTVRLARYMGVAF